MKNLFHTLFSHDLIVPVLGICPLLIVTTNLISGVSMGMICLATLIMINVIISGLRNLVSYELRIAIILFVSATLATVIHFAMQTWFYDLSLLLGIYIPLIAMNCLVLANAEGHALRNSVLNSFLYSLKAGAAMLLLLIIVGMIREIIGFGSVLQQSELLFGDIARSWKITLLYDDFGLPFFKMAPGAFFVLGLALAFRNFLETRTERITAG